jgi:hypothetical protein
MTSQTSTPTLQVCRDCGGGSPIDAHFCPQCTKILSLGRQGDYFGFLGLPRKLNIDSADLEQRFRALSRQFHPDFFYNATPPERGRASSVLVFNDAYRTCGSRLRASSISCSSRLAPGSPEEAGKQVPRAAEEVFALTGSSTKFVTGARARAPAEE